MQITIRPKRLAILLALIILGLTLANIAAQFALIVIGKG